MLVWQIVSGARAQQTWISLDDAASLNFSNIEGSDDDNNGDNFPQLAEVLVAPKADTEQANINQQVGVRNVQRVQVRATSTKDYASPRGTKKDCIEIGDLRPLHRAALQGDVDSIKAALEEGADIEGFSPAGATPLTLAASKGHHDAIKRLLASGANINAASKKGWTALMIAVRKEDARTVKQLTRNGADLNPLSPDHWTALAEATYKGQKEMMRIMLQYGADTEARSSHDRTPLMHASYEGDEGAVRLLLEAGSNTEAMSAHHETAILLAAAGGYTNIVRMLLMYGCAPEPAWAKDQKASSKGLSQKVKAKAKAKEIGEQEDSWHARGWTPLMHASQGGHVEIGQMLLTRNVNTEARSPDGKTALEIARENGRKDMVLILDFARNHNKCHEARRARCSSVYL